MKLHIFTYLIATESYTPVKCNIVLTGNIEKKKEAVRKLLKELHEAKRIDLYYEILN